MSEGFCKSVYLEEFDFWLYIDRLNLIMYNVFDII